jgi:hypothetical protein
MTLLLINPNGSFLDRLKGVRKRFGFSGVAAKAATAVMHGALRTSIFKVVWLDRDLLRMPPRNPDFEYRLLTADEVGRFAQDPDYYLGPEIAERVRIGREKVFAALSGDRLAAFGCYALGSIGPERASGIAMSYPSDVAYMAFGLTHPDFRGARLHGLLMGLALQELEAFGVTKLVSIVEWSNASSLKSCWRLGYRCLGTMTATGGSRGAFGTYPKAAKALGVKFGRQAEHD